MRDGTMSSSRITHHISRITPPSFLAPDTDRPGSGFFSIDTAKRIVGIGRGLSLSPREIFVQQRPNTLFHLLDITGAGDFVFLELSFEVRDRIPLEPFIE